LHAAEIARQFSIAAFVAQQNARGLSHEESLAAPDPGGNCANWVMGHMLASRALVLDLLETGAPYDRAMLEPYGRGSAQLTAEDAVDFTVLRKAHRASQKTIEAALAAATPEQLATPLDDPDGRLGETVRSALVFFAFHDGYHTGQLGLLRRVAGKDGAIS